MRIAHRGYRGYRGYSWIQGTWYYDYYCLRILYYLPTYLQVPIYLPTYPYPCLLLLGSSALSPIVLSDRVKYLSQEGSRAPLSISFGTAPARISAVVAAGSYRCISLSLHPSIHPPRDSSRLRNPHPGHLIKFREIV
ncbi:hypothetical protein CGRA01v4_07498 [Colletotrichum graminicola]|nr:hypothetical protein CGRA01v4_07498 [Colletotrichum graminicola]